MDEDAMKRRRGGGQTSVAAAGAVVFDLGARGIGPEGLSTWASREGYASHGVQQWGQAPRSISSRRAAARGPFQKGARSKPVVRRFPSGASHIVQGKTSHVGPTYTEERSARQGTGDRPDSTKPRRRFWYIFSRRPTGCID